MPINVFTWCGWQPQCLNCNDALCSDNFTNQSQWWFQWFAQRGMHMPCFISRCTILHDITVQMGLLHALSQVCQSMTKHFHVYDMTQSGHSMMITCKWASCSPKLGAPMAHAYTVATRMKLRKNSHPNVIPGHSTNYQQMHLVCSIAVCYADVPKKQWCLPGALRTDVCAVWCLGIRQWAQSSALKHLIVAKLPMCVSFVLKCRATMIVCLVVTCLAHDMKCVHSA